MAEAREMLEALLSDPIIQLVMKSDGVSADDVRLLMEEASERTAQNQPLPPAHMIKSDCEFGKICV
ncbi:hypothetical protein L598_003800000010 [Mesorhizobium sp. J18]|uniref:hypothetical protein n=1 Tax=Mesorhizobium sp. J18 TaxID=935263 RepID=UPI001198E57F|nr:hypothetical protein [Mesorhizobium sp. J18]TWG94158.1 hypothetical protein L598_003800000010 [Mesorhizobium sp. J18]